MNTLTFDSRYHSVIEEHKIPCYTKCSLEFSDCPFSELFSCVNVGKLSATTPHLDSDSFVPIQNSKDTKMVNETINKMPDYFFKNITVICKAIDYLRSF